MEMTELLHLLKADEGAPIRIMEVCGTHTAAILQNGLHSLLPSHIQLISGPGCPVCVTPAAYIDRCIALAQTPGHKLYSFGDMLKVRGTELTLAEAKARGAHVSWVYSPMELLDKAVSEPDAIHVFAGVGFETTAPVYALLVQEAEKRQLKNIRLLTAIKTIIPALRMILEQEENIHGFLAPGHVSAILGSNAYRTLAETYGKPFAVAGFTAPHILSAVYELSLRIRKHEGTVDNLYPSVVSPEGNRVALAAMDDVFEPGDAAWRGLGIIPGSGLYLKAAYAHLDVGSHGLDTDGIAHPACRCSDVILGRCTPAQCPLFGKACDPAHAQGPCMVSSEGACGIWYRFGGGMA